MEAQRTAPAASVDSQYFRAQPPVGNRDLRAESSTAPRICICFSPPHAPGQERTHHLSNRPQMSAARTLAFKMFRKVSKNLVSGRMCEKCSKALENLRDNVPHVIGRASSVHSLCWA